MSCNCKNKNKLEDAYGIPMEENLVEKAARMVLKVFMFFLLISLAVVVTPIVIGVLVYKISFSRDTTITLPKFMGKYMK